MKSRVGICAVAQTKYERDMWYQRFQGMVWEVVDSLIKQTGLTFEDERGINTVVTVSDDLFDARTISDNAITDAAGAHYRCEEKVAQDGSQAVYYGCAIILSGHADYVMIVGHCKESQGKSRNYVTHLAFDPFLTREVGMDYLVYNALQAQEFMRRFNVTEEQLAEIVVRSRQNAQKNSYTNNLPVITQKDVLNSPYTAEPIRELFTYPVSDGAVGMILAAEEKAKAITEHPVWITGIGNCQDHFFPGDRDLTDNFALKKAAERVYSMAGITNPAEDFDIVELSDQYAHHLPLWSEGLGLCPDGKIAKWLEDGGPDRANVNLSGGILAGNPMILGGLVRVAEASLQLSGKAGMHQVSEARKALAHGITGPAGQLQTVIVMERDSI